MSCLAAGLVHFAVGHFEMDEAQLRSRIRLHPACFSEIFAGRHVNNLYFDTPAYTSYDENVAGLSKRVKVRIRWYGDAAGPVSKPVLELKIKSNHVGAKASYRLIPFEVSRRLDSRAVASVLAASELPDHVREGLFALKPVLFNRYYRNYYRSRDERFRITLDQSVGYRRFGGAMLGSAAPLASLDTHIVELKYATGQDDHAERVTTEFAFRNTKNSKYVNGIDFLRSQGQA